MIEQTVRQRRLARTEDVVSERLGGETDPPYVTTAENFLGWDHARMYNATQSIDGPRIRQLAETYNEIAALIPFGLGVALLKATIHANWEGPAADEASAAVDLLGRRGIELRESINVIGVKLHQVHAGIDAIKAAVPPPDTSIVQSLSGAYQQTTHENREDARQAAALALTNLYTPLYRDAGTDVPTLPEPQNRSSPMTMIEESPSIDAPPPPSEPVSEVSTADVSPQLGDDRPDSPTYPATPTSVTVTSTVVNHAATQPVVQYGVAQAPTNHPGPALHTAHSPACSGAARFTPSPGTSFTSTPAGTTGAVRSDSGASPTPTRATSAATNSLLPNAVRAPGPGPFGAGSASTPVPVAPNGTSTPTPPVGSHPAAHGSRTIGGAGNHMMAAGGRGAAKGSADTEHKTPSYLVNVDNGTELIGRIAPVGPPVLR
ncbi:hypothetical protein [Rhodococcus sp. NPDC058521]|uniref:hypothetical protein n=1 Tax=Rhodococcus sp. NPDC058521 TaxID=3346536 RepID=UPI00365E3B3D